MTFENGTFYRIEESPEASPFELNNHDEFDLASFN